MPEYQPMAEIQSDDPIARAYLECAEWCGIFDDTGEGDRAALELSVSPKWDGSTETSATQLAADFRAEFKTFLDSETPDEGRIGHDLWLTRNGHGAGFWDGDWPEPFATKATDWSEAYGEAYVWFDAEKEILTIVG